MYTTINRQSDMNYADLLDRSPVPFHLLVKPVGSSCNLACQYCYYPQKDHTSGRMTDDVLKKFIEFYIRAQPKTAKEINFVWQGGEPLLAGIEFYERAIRYQKMYQPAGVRISNSMQTNGTMLNDEWCLFLKAQNFFVGISTDGLEALHDQHRVDKKNQPTFSKVIHGIELLKRYHIEFNVLVVVHDETVPHFKEIYDFFDDHGIQFIQFQPLMFEGDALKRSYTLSAKNWGDFLVNIYHYWQANRHQGRMFIMNLEHTYAQYFTNVSGTCVHAEYCGSNMALEPDGNLYACDHMINESHCVGKFTTQYQLIDSVKKAINLPFGNIKSQRTECQTCSVKFLCNGGCPSHLDHSGKNHLCEGYYHFYSAMLDELAKFNRDGMGLRQWQAQLKRP